MAGAHPFASPDRPGAVNAYLQQMAPGSRRVMAGSLELIADALSQGQACAADYPWGRATYADAVRLRAWLARGHAPATAARHLCAWRCVLREAWRLGQMPTDAYLRARDVRAPRRGEQRRRRLLRVDEVAALLSVAASSAWDVRDTAMVAVLCGCGLRRAELGGLDREHVDLASGVISVRQAKGGRPRDLVLPARLRGLLGSWLALRGDAPGALFSPLGATGRVLPRRISAPGIVWALNRLSTQQGVATFGPHALRRFYATELVERGVDLLTVQRLMGHANLSTLNVYLLRVNTAPAQADGLWESLVPGRPRVSHRAA
ncbi:MAG: site-specific integrase [Candidatus Dormibacteraeota bacterium]|nr:site-specific integrase [Candidatus Dormibacteraeota bacterium]